MLDSTVVFNELMYHPAESQILGDSSGEWIELYNQNGVDVEISGWSIRGGVEFQFPNDTILPGRSRLVVAADPTRIREQIGDVADVFGPFAGRLSNGGESIELRSHSDRVMDSLTYGDSLPWPAAADGVGFSLAKPREDTATGDPANWQHSLQRNGSPGAPNGVSNVDEFESWLGDGFQVRVQSPASDVPQSQWTQLSFDDANWSALGSGALGYDANGFEFAHQTRRFTFDDVDDEGRSFDEFEPAIAADVASATVTADRPPLFEQGQAIELDGVDDLVVIHEPFDTAAYTYSVWVKPAAIRAQSLVLRTSVSPFLFASHQLRMTNDGRFTASTGTGNAATVVGNTVAETGQWYHLVVTAGENGELRLFVNGLLDGESAAVGTISRVADQWQLGGPSSEGLGAPIRANLAGVLDQFEVWDHELNPAQIAALHLGVAGDNLSGIADVVEQDIRSVIEDQSTGAWLRYPFEASTSFYDQLSLTTRYDDGFVAYLNGIEIAKRNAPDDARWDSVAESERVRADSIVDETIDVSEFASLLNPGGNVLAVHALNADAADPDLLFEATLTARLGRLDQLPRLQLNEVAAGPGEEFWVEIINRDERAVRLDGMSIGVNGAEDQRVSLPSGQLAAGERLVLDTAALGLDADAGDVVSLLSPDARTAFECRSCRRSNTRAP